MCTLCRWHVKGMLTRRIPLGRANEPVRYQRLPDLPAAGRPVPYFLQGLPSNYFILELLR